MRRASLWAVLALGILCVVTSRQEALAACSAANECVTEQRGYAALVPNAVSAEEERGYSALQPVALFVEEVRGYSALCCTGEYVTELRGYAALTPGTAGVANSLMFFRMGK